MSAIVKFISAKLRVRQVRGQTSFSSDGVWYTNASNKPQPQADDCSGRSDVSSELQVRCEQLERSCGRLARSYAELYKENESLKESRAELQKENDELRKERDAVVKREECTGVQTGLARDVDELREILCRASTIVNQWQMDNSAETEVDDTVAMADGDGRSQTSEQSFELVGDDASDCITELTEY